MRRLIVALAACGGTPAPAPATATTPDSPCRAAVAHHYDLMDAELEKEDVMHPGERRYRLSRDEMTQRCIDDLWSPQVIRCETDATTADALEPCFQQLTPAQRDAIARQIQAK